MSELAKGITTLVSGVILTGFLIWGGIFVVGDTIRIHKEYNERQQEQVVSGDMHDPMVIPEESSYDDGTGGYGQHIRPNGKLGTGYDMGGGVVMKPNGEIGFGIDLGL